MLLSHISLDRQSAALYLGIPETLLVRHLPEKQKFNLEELDRLERIHFKDKEWISHRWTSEDYVLRLEEPPISFKSALKVAMFPAELDEAVVIRAADFLAKAPFLSSIIDVLYYLNQFTCQDRPMELAAEALSQWNMIKLEKVPKPDVDFKNLLVIQNHLPFLD